MDKQPIRAIFNGVCASGEGGAMTRAELYTLVHQVLEARAFLAAAEQRYSDLNNKLMQELSEKYPLEGGEQ